MADIDRRRIVIDKLEYWSEFNCFHIPGINPRLKTCQCLVSLHGSNGHKNCVTNYLLFWVRLDKVPRTMTVIEKLNILNDGQKNNKKPFIIPFVASQLPWTNEFMTNKFIRKEALGTLFGYGHKELKTLVC